MGLFDFIGPASGLLFTLENIIWINDFLDISIPKQIIPDDIKNIFYNDKKLQ